MRLPIAFLAVYLATIAVAIPITPASNPASDSLSTVQHPDNLIIYYGDMDFAEREEPEKCRGDPTSLQCWQHLRERCDITDLECWEHGWDNVRA